LSITFLAPTALIFSREAIDAVDNGINQWDTKEPPKYISNTSLGARVANLNPKWNEDGSEDVLNRQFLKAVELTGAEFSVSGGRLRWWDSGCHAVGAAIRMMLPRLG
jgi:uncharacterized UPF0160 family protein